MDVDNNKENLIKHFLTIAPKHCENCGAKYSEADFNVIKSSPQGIVLHLTCQACKNNFVLNVMGSANGVFGTQKVPLNIDLESDAEMDYFAGNDAISEDDALDVFNAIPAKSKREDIEKLFQF